ncbi:DUF2158 domain-containing protein [Massilia sp. DWR3-1-1]|uniref:DUF2158 domain-containing protein n=1 Tax=Massilia sp. DWR3-1-1 TaxID=2804559 RepID=UPI003CF1D812
MNFNRFNVGDLVVCYAPPSLRSVMPGNRVMLRSGGPEMTVCDVNDQGQALCQWMDGESLVVNAFDLECLTCYGAR